MKLKTVHVKEYKSILDSNQFEVSDITCLVGKNEAGKTALLEAIYRLNPIESSMKDFDVTDDYPRLEVGDYRKAVDNGEREPAIVVEATFNLEDADLFELSQHLGPDALLKTELVLRKGYRRTPTDAHRSDFELAVNAEAVLQYLLSSEQLTPETSAALKDIDDFADALQILQQQEQYEAVVSRADILSEICASDVSSYIYNKFIRPRVPKFVYFDEYYQMRGQENIQSLRDRKQKNQLRESDHPMLGLIELAGLDLDDLLNVQRTQELKNSIEGAGNSLGRRVLKYWSQNRHLKTRFDVREGRPGDPPELRNGVNIWAEIYDSRHEVTTSMGSRSRGFVWFFSFLAWYSQLQNDPVILLLDEPGLSLHGKAQEDLLRYFEQELKPNHQVIYTTHSPFMVDPRHFERVRIVQDKGIDVETELPREEDGTKVFNDVFEASEDSLFPLQGALGYEIYQTLFIGPNSLVVEGVSDLLYIQAMSSVLERNNRVGLSTAWTITPVGGADKVPTFVALIGSQKGLNVATLIDVQEKDEQQIQNLYKKKLLKKKNVLTFADFVGSREADIEDMFDTDFYLSLVNCEYQEELSEALTLEHLNMAIPRVLVRLDKYFADHPMEVGFSHFRPARYFTEHLAELADKLSESTLNRFENAFVELNKLVR